MARLLFGSIYLQMIISCIYFRFDMTNKLNYTSDLVKYAYPKTIRNEDNIQYFTLFTVIQLCLSDMITDKSQVDRLVIRSNTSRIF